MAHRQGPRSKFKDQVFWAEGGLICVEDQRNGAFKVMTRAEAAARTIALNGELSIASYYPSEKDELLKCVCNLAEAVKEAKRQGDPTDPDVRRQRIKDIHKVSILLPQFSGSGMLVESDRFKKLRI